MRLFLVIALGLFLVLPGWAQERVSHVQIRVIDSSQLEIRYDLLAIRPGDSIYFNVQSRLRGNLQIAPEFVRGDVGKQITSGTERRIVWDALANGYALNEEIRATVLVKTGSPITANQLTSPAPIAAAQPPVAAPKVEVAPTTPSIVTESVNEPKPVTPERSIVSVPEQTNVQPAETKPLPAREERQQKTRYVGPAWALLSAVAPGIGNIFVQTPKPKVGIRPLLTVGCYGLVVYGLMERQKSQDNYAIYSVQKNMTAGEPYYQMANMHHQRYFLATRGAIVLAAADVILTFIRGVRNTKLQKASSITVWPGLQAGQLTAVARYSF
ncbi:hypothetical protein [Spirosoma endophyticum]|uniref:DUF5683 domain-containing protein n=1 Tax=Spirosoma endophyticum TaxID=662367 RepID=A0A1I1IDR7_9BACT|nr:hypothetical protein [Spirosoma endophyticum]SFC31360.1 hypothetical protein SAMN05216167_101851 [Spirosoma endophyticum]